MSEKQPKGLRQQNKDSKGTDTTQGENVAPEPLQDATEVVETLVETVAEQTEEIVDLLEEDDPQENSTQEGAITEEHVEMPEPLEDFPIQYEVEARIEDPYNPASLVHYIIHLTGPNDEDLGTTTLMQDLRGLADDSITARGEVLAQERVKALYESENYQKLIKSAPKRKTQKVSEVNLEPLIAESNETKQELRALKDNLSKLVQKTQNTKTDEDIEKLRTDLANMSTQMADIQAGQRTIVEWLGKLHRVLSS